MRNISQEAIDLFNKDYRQVVRIHFSKGDTAFDITEADIIQGGMTIDRYCVSGSKIEVGSAVAAELTLRLRNYDGKFDAVSFEGATLTVEVGIKKWDALAWEKAQLHWVPCGQFIIDTPPRTLDTISISALDRMVLFDKEVDTSKLHLPASIESLVKQICTQCGVTLQTDVGHLPNSFFSVGSLTTSDGSAITYRQVLRWCAAMTGTCAYIDVDGSLVMGWYEATNFTFDASQRYSSDMLENDIVLTGFTFSYLDKDNKTRTYLAGTKDYTLDLSNCALLTNNQEGVIKRIYEARGGFRYRPYSAIVKSAPYLFPMDIIHYVDKKGVTHDTIVTNVTFTLNCNTAISAVGETITSSSYSTANKGITDQQATANSNSSQQFEKVDSTLDEHQKKVDELFKQADDLYGKADDAFSQIDNLGTNIDGLTKDLTVVKHEITDVNTSIEQTNEEIKLRATKTEAKEYAESAGQDAVATSKTYTDSQIQMTSESIALKVSKDEAVKMVDAAKSAAATDASTKSSNAIAEAKKYTDSQIQMTSESIALKVSKDDIISTINQTAGSIMIQADKIDLKGHVTADILDTSAISKLLWTNPSPSQPFRNNTVTVTVNDNVGFKSFMILFSGFKVNGKKYPTSCAFIPFSSQFGITHCLSMAYPDSEVYDNGTWYSDDYTKSNATRFVRVTDNFATNRTYSFKFSDAYFDPGSIYNFDDSYIIPLEIYGIR